MERVVRHYMFHGLGVRISSDAGVSAALHSRLQDFSVNGCENVDFDFDFRSVPENGTHIVDRPIGPARPVYGPSAGEVMYFDSTDQLYIDYGDRVRVLCNLQRGHVLVSARHSEKDNLWLVSHPMFTLPLLELLKRRGKYCCHAAGFRVDGRGVLIAGASGSGKSTLSLALLRGGLGFLGDDMVFLTAGREGRRILAFPDEIDVTDETIAFFPELHYLLNEPKSPGWPKRQVRAENVYKFERVFECAPAVLVSPSIANVDKSLLKPLDPGEALLELVPNILLTAPEPSQAHMDALAGLIRDSACYRLETGRDFESLPKLFYDLFK